MVLKCQFFSSYPRDKIEYLQYSQWYLILIPLSNLFGYMIVELIFMHSSHSTMRNSIIVLIMSTILIASGLILYGGHRKLIHYIPNRSYTLHFLPCIYHGFRNWLKQRKTNPRPFWLDHADDIYEENMINYLKIFVQSFPVYVILVLTIVMYKADDRAAYTLMTQMNMSLGFLKSINHFEIFVPPLIILLMYPLIVWIVERGLPLKLTDKPYGRMMVR